MPNKEFRTPFYGAIPTTSLPADKITYGSSNVKAELDSDDARLDKLEAKFELIEEITLTESVNIVERTQTPDGKNYNFKELYILVNAVGVGCDLFAGFYDGIIGSRFMVRTVIDSTIDKKHLFIANCSKGILDIKGYYGPNNYTVNSLINASLFTSSLPYEMNKFDKITLDTIGSGSPQLQIGTKIKIYGIWA